MGGARQGGGDVIVEYNGYTGPSLGFSELFAAYVKPSGAFRIAQAELACRQSLDKM